MVRYSRPWQGIGRRLLLTATASTLAFPAAIRAQGKSSGVALVIGNSRYQWEASLPNVRRDVFDIAKRFQALGLKTELVQDANRAALQRAVDSFKSAARGANLAAFYFAGHGANWEKDTYVVPVDADLSSPNVVQSLVNVSSIQEAMAVATSRLLVFDSCRNNPADGWRQLAAQRSAVVHVDDDRGALAAPPNTLVLYSTAPGRVALDGPAGDNSPFAAAFLRQLDGQSSDLRTLPTKLRRDLLLATQGRQVLWDHNTYKQSFPLQGRPIANAESKPGWADNTSGIIELPNAYAYAAEKGIPLPAGLIAHRPAGSSRDSRKVGSFKYVASTKFGPDSRLMLVMSVEEKSTAEIIQAGTKYGSGNSPY
jgi:hypothetical protein